MNEIAVTSKILIVHSFMINMSWVHLPNGHLENCPLFGIIFILQSQDTMRYHFWYWVAIDTFAWKLKKEKNMNDKKMISTVRKFK